MHNNNVIQYPLTPKMTKVRRVRQGEYHLLNDINTIIDKVYMTDKDFKSSPFNTLRKV